MKDSLDRPFSQPYRCRDCGSEIGFRSRRRTITERLFVLMKPVRCGECFRRDYRWFWTPVRERFSETPRMMPVKSAAAPPPNRNVA